MSTPIDVSAVAAEFSKPFPEEVLEKVPVGEGKVLDYVPIEHVIQRLNSVLGIDGWSSQTLSTQYVETANAVVATVSLTLHLPGRDVTVTRSDAATIRGDLGNAFKAAESGALKKAAMDKGIGLYLAFRKGSSGAASSSLPQPSAQAQAAAHAAASTGDGTLVAQITGMPQQRRVGQAQKLKSSVDATLLSSGEVVELQMWQDDAGKLMGLHRGQSIAFKPYKESMYGNPPKRQFSLSDFTVVGENPQDLTPQPAQPGASAPAAPTTQTTPTIPPGKGAFSAVVTLVGATGQKTLERDGQQHTRYHRSGTVPGAVGPFPAGQQVTVAAYDTVGGALSSFPENEQVYVEGQYVVQEGKSPVVWASSLKTVAEVLAEVNASAEEESFPEPDEPPRLAGLGG